MFDNVVPTVAVEIELRVREGDQGKRRIVIGELLERSLAVVLVEHVVLGRVEGTNWVKAKWLHPRDHGVRVGVELRVPVDQVHPTLGRRVQDDGQVYGQVYAALLCASAVVRVVDDLEPLHTKVSGLKGQKEGGGWGRRFGNTARVATRGSPQ